jgi:ABC-type arginine/histidine transport system permease subunit
MSYKNYIMTQKLQQNKGKKGLTNTTYNAAPSIIHKNHRTMVVLILTTTHEELNLVKFFIRAFKKFFRSLPLYVMSFLIL